MITIKPTSGPDLTLSCIKDRVFIHLQYDYKAVLLPEEAASLARHIDHGVGLMQFTDVFDSKITLDVNRDRPRVVLKIVYRLPTAAYDFAPDRAADLSSALGIVARQAGFVRFVECEVKITHVDTHGECESPPKRSFFQRLLGSGT